MARYCGMIGFSESKSIAPGIHEDIITERKYYGDVTKDFRKTNSGDKIVSDISLNNLFSIVADPFAFENFQFIKYVKYLGIAFEVESVEVQYPRLLISIGGRWNGPTGIQSTETSENS